MNLDEPRHAERPPPGISWRAKLPALRLAAACLLTWSAIPYCWIYVLIGAIEFGVWKTPHAAGLATALLAVIALTFHLGEQEFLWRRRRRLAATLVGVWLIVCGAAFWSSMATFVPRGYVLLIALPATLYVIWVGWMFFYPWRWSTRAACLAALLLLTLPYWVLLEFVGFAGDLRLHFAWRDWSRVSWQGAGEPAGAATALSQSPRGDFAHFLGPHRDAVVDDANLARDWLRDPPRTLWRREVGEAWSALAVSGSLAFTQEQRGDLECVVAYGLLTGEPVWTHSWPSRFDSSMGGVGPRATPSIWSSRVYAVGAAGRLVCLDAASGEEQWSADILAGAENTYHGVAASPLVLAPEQLVVVAPPGPGGPSLAAYDLTSGAKKWAAGGDRASYSSPQLATLAGVRQLLLHHEEGLTAHDLEGEQLWRFPWANSVKTAVSQPIVNCGSAGQVFLSTGYGKGSVLLDVRYDADRDAWRVESLWTSKAMKAKYCTPVRFGDHIYGLDDGILACISVADGRRRWKGGRYGHGQILLASGLLLVLSEVGDLVLVEANPEQHRELARIPALTGKTWNHLALAGPYLLVRNSREAACFELPERALATPEGP